MGGPACGRWRAFRPAAGQVGHGHPIKPVVPFGKTPKCPRCMRAAARLPSDPCFGIHDRGASGRRVPRWRVRRRFPVRSECRRRVAAVAVGRTEGTDRRRDAGSGGALSDVARKCGVHANRLMCRRRPVRDGRTVPPPTGRPAGIVCAPGASARPSHGTGSGSRLQRSPWTPGVNTTGLSRMRAAFCARTASPTRTAKPNGIDPYSRPKAALEAVAAGHPNDRFDDPLRPTAYSRMCSNATHSFEKDLHGLLRRPTKPSPIGRGLWSRTYCVRLGPV